MHRIEDKRVVVTGATSGIGKEVATRLACLGANVVLACRDRTAAERVAAEIDTAAGGQRTSVMTVDTSDQGSIRDFGRDYRDTYGRLDVLINNAGTLRPDRATSVDEIELTFATNVLGYHLVTQELLPALEAAAPSRIVNVASAYAFGVDLDDLQFVHRPYDGMTAYAQSKACNRMLTWALARRLKGREITANAMAPGLVMATELYRHLSSEARHELAQYGSRDLSEAADTVVWLAADAEAEGVTDRFFELRAELACDFRDEQAEERLWDACDDLSRHGGQVVQQR